MGLNVKENGEGRRRSASNEASFPSLFNIELMLSCAMKRSQTLRCSKRGSRGVSGGVGLCESTHTMPLSVWTASASYGPILPHIPLHHPLYHQICSRATETGGPGTSAYFVFQAELSLLGEKGPSFLVWQTRLHPSKNEHHPPALGAGNHMRCTCVFTWTHMSQALIVGWSPYGGDLTKWVHTVQI